jgi:hypothetical protein
LRFTASLDTVTDTLNKNWYCAYANEFPVAVEDLDVEKLRTTAQEAMGLYGGVARGGMEHNFGWKTF